MKGGKKRGNGSALLAHFYLFFSKVFPIFILANTLLNFWHFWANGAFLFFFYFFLLLKSNTIYPSYQQQQQKSYIYKVTFKYYTFYAKRIQRRQTQTTRQHSPKKIKPWMNSLFVVQDVRVPSLILHFLDLHFV